MSSEDRKELYNKVLVDGNKEVDYLDTNIINYVPDEKNLITYIVPGWCVGRIDLISFIHYRTTRLWWLIAQINDIQDPINDIVLGMELQIPNITDYYNFYNINSILDTIPEDGFESIKIEI